MITPTKFVTMQSTIGTFHTYRTVSSTSVHQNTVMSSIYNPSLTPICLTMLESTQLLHLSQHTQSICHTIPSCSCVELSAYTQTWEISKECNWLLPSECHPTLLPCEDGWKGQPQHNSYKMQKNKTMQSFLPFTSGKPQTCHNTSSNAYLCSRKKTSYIFHTLFPSVVSQQQKTY